MSAHQLWREGGWVFATATGEPLNPNRDYHQWEDLLKRVGLRDARLHDARQTAVTVLLLLGIPERTVSAIMG
ncbi:tyrosine-type recombinase/integrase [Sphaerisporangium corydalis]|uniref:Tyrosine-type recombinase/integrase n=1 Tax=Sphaerisporangium corydalis TaxID=1441875 RepID=A0ABV9EF90_9ACTN|nr:tyrosine-type recombinase/integrase [Sphaerisporangium corydalis]